MGYQQAMEAAGANVLAFQEFGSYQGDWWAKVEYEGKTYWVHGWYGSCSGCDAFQGHFGYGFEDEEHCEEHRYASPDEASNCDACAEAAKKYQQELADFGKSYIFCNEYTQQEAEKEASEGLYQDEDQLKFLKENAIEGTGKAVENPDYNLDGL